MNLKYMLHILITLQFRVRDQRSRSEVKVKGQGQRSHIKKFGEWVGGVYAFVCVSEIYEIQRGITARGGRWILLGLID